MSGKINWRFRLYRWACQRLYDELAWTYDLIAWLVSCGRWSQWRRAALAPLLTNQSAEQPRILELGFGTGELLVELAQRTNAVYGLELSSAMQQVTSLKLQRHGVAVPRVQAEAPQLPFANESFAGIVATFPTDYILKPATLQECARLLTPASPQNGLAAGRLVIVGLWVTLRPRWLQRLVPFFYGEPSTEWLQELVQRCEVAGLQGEVTTHQDGCFAVSMVILHKV